MNKVLCPVDFSDDSRKALQMAAVLARESGAELIRFHSLEVAATYPEDLSTYQSAEAMQRLQEKLDEVILPEPTPSVRRVLVEGTAIVDVARDEKVDMIVLSTHGRSGLTRLLMGSVAEYVVRHATCPVLTLKTAAPVPAAP